MARVSRIFACVLSTTLLSGALVGVIEEPVAAYQGATGATFSGNVATQTMPSGVTIKTTPTMLLSGSSITSATTGAFGNGIYNQPDVGMSPPAQGSTSIAYVIAGGANSPAYGAAPVNLMKLGYAFSRPVSNPTIYVYALGSALDNTDSSTPPKQWIYTGNSGFTFDAGTPATPTFQKVAGFINKTVASNGISNPRATLTGATLDAINLQKYPLWCNHPGSGTVCGTGKLMGSAANNGAVSSASMTVDFARNSWKNAAATTEILNTAQYQSDQIGINFALDENLGGTSAGRAMPTSYGSVSHVNTDLRLGTNVSINGAQILAPSTTPTAQSTKSGNDGVTTLPVIVGGRTNTFTAKISGAGLAKLTGSTVPYVNAWIDFNGDGVLGTGELIAGSVGTINASGNATVTFTTTTAQANTAASNAGKNTFMRVRTSYNSAQLAAATGYADSGEVEDYDLGTILPAPSGTLTVAKSTTSISGTTSNPAGPAQVGDVITYAVTATNNTNVILSNVTVSDPIANTLTCKVGSTNVTLPVSSLAIGGVVSCVAKHTVTAADLTAAKVRNVATASGTTPGGDPFPGTTATVDTPVVSTPSGQLKVAKSVTAVSGTTTNVNGPVQSGDVISYKVTATNSSGVVLTNVRITDPLVSNLTCKVSGSTVTLPLATLAIGGVVDCTATYTVKAADVTAGNVHNVANAVGATPAGTDLPATPATTDTKAVPTATGPLVVSKSVTKVGGSTSNTAGPVQAGDVITFGITATNSSGVTLTGVGVADALLRELTCSVGGTKVVLPIASLANGGIVSCSGSYSVTATDVLVGNVHNVATGSGTTPAGTPVVTTPGTTVTAVVPTATGSLVVNKRVTAISGTTSNVAGPAQAGDVITYGVTATNNSGVTLTDVRISDALLPSMSCQVESRDVILPMASLAAGASIDCSGTYTVTAADVAAGSVHNVATAAGTTPARTPVLSTPGSTDTPAVPTATGMLEVEKVVTAIAGSTSNVDGPAQIGDVISYSITATNNSGVTLTVVGVADPLLRNMTCSVDGSRVSFPIVALPVDGVVDCSGTYTITSADVAAGNVRNIATATGTTPAGPAVESTTGETNTSVVPTASGSLIVEKSVTAISGSTNDVNGLAQAGDEITYGITATNLSGVTLSDVTITDSLVPELSCRAEDVNASLPVASLADGGAIVCSGTYIVTTADVVAGFVHNVATASGTTPGGEAVPQIPGSTDTPVVPTPTGALEVDKFVTAVAGSTAQTDGPAEIGDVISYGITATNNSGVILTNVTIADPLISDLRCSMGGSNVTIPLAVMPVDGIVSCSGSYTVTLDDMAAGTVHNVATASGTTPAGTPVATTPDSTDTPVVPSPTGSLDVSKSVTAISGSTSNTAGPAQAGDVITYGITASNNSNVILSNVDVSDVLLANMICSIDDEEITLPAETLAVGGSIECVGSYTVTDADVADATVHNVATASGKTPSGTEIPNVPGTTDTPVVPTATGALEVAKSVTAIFGTTANVAGPAQLGDVISYGITATNNSGVRLTNVDVSDAKLADMSCSVDGTDVTLPVAALEVDGVIECSGSYTVTDADVIEGVVHNVATASGTTPGKEDVPDVPGEVDVPIVPSLNGDGLSLVKRAVLERTDADGAAMLHSGITYMFDVTNNGPLAESDLAIDDPMLAEAGIAITCPVTELEPGASVTCESEAGYVVSWEDQNVGVLRNVATASAKVVATGELVSAGARKDVAVAPSPAPVEETPSNELNVVKVADVSQVGANGRVTYTIEVANLSPDLMARQVAVLDVLPSEMSFVAAAEGSYDAATHSVAWLVNEIAPGDSVAFNVTVTVAANARPGTTIVNTAIAGYDGDPKKCDEAAEDCAGSASVTVVAGLPSTGAGVAENVLLSVVAMLAGFWILVVVRRRRVG